MEQRRFDEHTALNDALLMVREAMVAKAAMMTARAGTTTPTMVSRSQPHRI